jgi:hypothetical protein
MENTKWMRWENRNKIDNNTHPGIYFIAYSEEDISGTTFSMLEEILYIGMTISKGGFKSRLAQFNAGMEGKTGHGGADRVRFKHNDSVTFFKNTYVSVKAFLLSTSKDTPDDWRIKANCVAFEYVSFANYLEKHKRLPEFNDHTKSKKK